MHQNLRFADDLRDNGLPSYTIIGQLITATARVTFGSITASSSHSAIAIAASISAACLTRLGLAYSLKFNIVCTCVTATALGMVALSDHTHLSILVAFSDRVGASIMRSLTHHLQLLMR